MNQLALLCLVTIAIVVAVTLGAALALSGMISEEERHG